MTDKTEIKEKLFEACEQEAEGRIKTIQAVLSSIEEARNNETKSSVGDKYETGRAMMQIEEANNRNQLARALQLRQELIRVNPNKVSTKVEVGSLVETNNGSYYISIGLGKLTLDEQLYYCISINSPIGTKLMNKVAGDEVDFNGRKIKIIAIY